MGEVECCGLETFKCLNKLLVDLRSSIIGSVTLNIKQLHRNYSSNLGRNHEATDNDESEKPSPCLLDEHPKKHAYPQKQGWNSGGIGRNVQVHINFDLFSCNFHFIIIK